MRRGLSNIERNNRFKLVIYILIIILIIFCYFVLAKSYFHTSPFGYIDNKPKSSTTIPKPLYTPANTSISFGILNSSSVSKCNVYTYGDRLNNAAGKHCLDKITIKGVYFVAKNQKSGIKPYWNKSMLQIFTEIKQFYESQFNHKINITIDQPVMIYGGKNIEDYTQYGIAQEIRRNITINTTDNFVVLMFYPIQGEHEKRVIDTSYGYIGGEESSAAMNSWFWLDPKSLGTVTTKFGTDYSGYLNSAHEFGHTLGIPHPWIENSSMAEGSGIDGDIMGYYSQGPLIENSFITHEVKEKMIIN